MDLVSTFWRASAVGNLTLGSGSAGTTATLRTTAGTGDVILNGTLIAGGNVTVESISDALLARVESNTGDVSVTANAGSLTGVSGGRGTLLAKGSGGDITVNTRDQVFMQTLAGDTVSVTSGLLDIDTAQSRVGLLSLTANITDIIVGAAASNGDATLTAARDVSLLRKLVARGNILITAGRDVNYTPGSISSMQGTVTIIDP